LNNLLETNSQEAHYSSAAKINQLMLFRETVAFIVRTVGSKDSVDRMAEFFILKQVVRIEPLGLRGLKKIQGNINFGYEA
jgi:hypothetical protein